MTGRTHAMVGANAIWITALFTPIDPNIIWLIPVAALAGLLPDIDAFGTGAKIHYVGGGLLNPFRGVFRHRGFTHSLVATLLSVIAMGIVTILYFPTLYPILPIVFGLSYLSHLVIDGLNKSGMMLLWPSKKMVRLVPKFMASKMDGPIDQLLFFTGAAALLVFLVIYYFPIAINSFSVTPTFGI